MQKASVLRGSMEIVSHVITGSRGYNFPSSGMFTNQAVEIDQYQLYLNEMTALLVVYIGNHHGEDIAW